MLESLVQKWDRRKCKRKCKSAIEAAEKLIKRRIPISSARLAELEVMQQSVDSLPDAAVVPHCVCLLGINLQPELAATLTHLELSRPVQFTACEVHDRPSLLTVLARASGKKKQKQQQTGSPGDGSKHGSNARIQPSSPSNDYTDSDGSQDSSAAGEGRGPSLRSPLITRGRTVITDSEGNPAAEPPSREEEVEEGLPKPFYAVVLQAHGEQLGDLEAEIIALTFMSSHPILTVATAGSEAASQAAAITGGTWPVFGGMHGLLHYVKEVLPRTLRLKHTILTDVAGRTNKYKEVSKVLHGVKRGAVAFVPFGVHAVNFLGMARLMSRMMADTGMVADQRTASALAKMGAGSGLKVMAIDSLGDVYQFVVATNILTTATAVAASQGLSAALSTLDALDAAMLGSVSVVTGAVSAIGAYYTRPKLVASIAALLANLQLVALLNPSMRRGEGDGEGKGEQAGVLQAFGEGDVGAGAGEGQDVGSSAWGGAGGRVVEGGGGAGAGDGMGAPGEVQMAGLSSDFEAELRSEVEAEAAELTAGLLRSTSARQERQARHRCEQGPGELESAAAAEDGDTEEGGDEDGWSDLDLPLDIPPTNSRSSWAQSPAGDAAVGSGP